METLSSHEKFYIDPVLYHGRPAEDSGRLEKERKTYDLLDRLSIPYDRLDHEALPTIAACHQVDQILGTPICKNLFLTNAQKTKFYLLPPYLAPPLLLVPNLHFSLSYHHHKRQAIPTLPLY